MKLLRDSGAPHHLAALDHLYAQSGHRQIGRASEAVMPRADDDDICLGHVWSRHSGMTLRSLAKKCISEQLDVAIPVHRPALPGALPCAPLPVPASLAGIPGFSWLLSIPSPSRT